MGIASVGYSAQQWHRSPNYSGYLIKKAGKTAQEYTQAKLIDIANEKTPDAAKPVSEVE